MSLEKMDAPTIVIVGGLTVEKPHDISTIIGDAQQAADELVEVSEDLLAKLDGQEEIATTHS